jgi:hypothetical protein
MRLIRPLGTLRSDLASLPTAGRWLPFTQRTWRQINRCTFHELGQMRASRWSQRPPTKSFKLGANFFNSLIFYALVEVFIVFDKLKFGHSSYLV